MDLVQRRSPEGRPWTAKEWVQGRPLGVPTHSMFVHFPVALYLGVIVLDVLTRITPNAGLVLAGTYLLLVAFAGSAIAVSLGLLDWAGMISGSSKKRLATQHMVVQLTAAALFVAAFVMRWPERGSDQASLSWIAVEVLGYLVLVVGQHLGGLLVYQRGMRVSTGARSES